MLIQIDKPKRSPLAYFVPIALLAGMVVYLFFLLPRTAAPQKLPQDERKYFDSIYRDTWNYLASHIEKKTGLPYDSSSQQPPTSMTNVGLYLASTAIASRTGLISQEEGLDRIKKSVESLEQVEKWRGFPYPWILVRTLKPTHGDEFNYGPHLANLIGGLIVAKSTFPQVASRIDQLISKWDLKSLYDNKSEWLKGGYNIKTQNFAIYQPWGHWYYQYFAAETRLLSFYLVARKVVPKKHWYALQRPTLKQEGETVYATGVLNGGLSTQYLPGLFLDERETEMGKAQKNLARAQMKHAKKIGAPVWGWSPAQAPNGNYLIDGEYRDEIVAPYASMLAVIYFPKAAYQNLKKLEELGARPPALTGRKSGGPKSEVPGEGYGFLDTINWETGAVAKNWLTPSQGMAFLSLANLLYDGIVWKSFAEDPVVKQRLEIL